MTTLQIVAYTALASSAATLAGLGLAVAWLTRPAKCTTCGKKNTTWDSSFRDQHNKRVSIFNCKDCKSLFEVH